MGVSGPPRSGAPATRRRGCGALRASTLRPVRAHGTARLVRLGWRSARSVWWLVKRLGCLNWWDMTGSVGTALWVRLCGYGSVGTALWVRLCGYGSVGTALWVDPYQLWGALTPLWVLIQQCTALSPLYLPLFRLTAEPMQAVTSLSGVLFLGCFLAPVGAGTKKTTPKSSAPPRLQRSDGKKMQQCLHIRIKELPPFPKWGKEVEKLYISALQK